MINVETPRCLGSPHLTSSNHPDLRHVERVHHLPQAKGVDQLQPFPSFSITDELQVRCDLATHDPCTNCKKSDVECR